MSDQRPRTTRHDEPAARRSHLAVRSLRHGDTQTIELVGELDIEGGPIARRALTRARTANAHTIVLDLEGLMFMDSTGVHMIIDAHNRLSEQGRELVIVRAPAPVRRLLELCGLSDVLHLSDHSPPRIDVEQGRQARLTQGAMAAAVRAMRSLDRQRLRPPP
ncbi:MAG: anti-sigma factor antagonist [Solirubrobacteraceae bacterium]|jgi:anti-anti-sigma factor|nr:anti-sigma factor antagonist [Solirubrobacteraceae bacterium]